MTDRWPATYVPGTITSQPNSRSKKASRTMVALMPAEHRHPAPLLVIDCEQMLHLDTAAAAVSIRLSVEAVSGERTHTGGG